MKRRENIIILLISVVCGCTYTTGHQKHYDSNGTVVDVHRAMKVTDMDEIPMSVFSVPYVIDDYLIISDHKSPDRLIHLFDRNSFEYITSTGNRGMGPGEIANMGEISINTWERSLYVIDHGKQKIFSFHIDSVLKNPNYLPEEKINISQTNYPRGYEFIHDTLSVGLFVESTENGDYKPVVARLNMRSGAIVPMKYKTHPEIEKKRVSFAVSPKDGIYAECYWHYDLITIGNIYGDWLYNVYGHRWDNRTSNENSFYGDVVIANGCIIATYSGDRRFVEQEDGATKVVYPTKLIVFTLQGDYIKTLDTGYRIITFCYDEGNNRIIFALNDNVQFAYLDLEGVLYLR